MHQMPALARNTDPTTSHEAAASGFGSDLALDLLAVLAIHRTRPYVAEEIWSLYFPHWNDGTVKSALSRLKNKGYAVNDGAKRVPRGKTRAQLTWSITETGIALLESAGRQIPLAS